MSENRSFRAVQERNPALWEKIRASPKDFRVLTGERPTGRLHIGHYFGTLRNRVHLQEMGIETFIVIADYQALTDRGAGPELRRNVHDVVLDYLAVGLDPGAGTRIFCHSHIPDLNQLLLPFLSVINVSELQRNPTVKDEIAQTGQKTVSGLMFTYPAHQAADILFCRANLVPGGRDQLPHIELTRSIARRLNERYFEEPFFPEPELLLSNAPLILGLDGRKMGKSLNNAIFLASTADETATLIKKAKTDSDRTITYDPEGRPEVANLLLVASLCLDKTPETVADEIGDGGAKVLKATLTEAVNEYFREIRAKRSALAADPAVIVDVLREGNDAANAVATRTLDAVRGAMGMDYY